MKKFLNFAFIVAVLSTAFAFSSCSDDDDATLDITIDVATTTAVSGKVNASEGIKTAKLYSVTEDGRTSISGFSESNINKDGSFRIESLAAGNYELEITDKANNTKSKTFTVASGINYSATTISVAAGNYAYKHEGTEGTFQVTAAAAGSVTLKIGTATVTLSDAGNSYLGTDFKEMNLDAAKANPSKVLFCLLSNSTTIASGTEAANADVKAGAKETKFAVVE